MNDDEQTQHDEFLRGFGEGMGLSGLPHTIEAAYINWRETEDLSAVDLIDLESGGYQTGVDVGRRWKFEQWN